MDRGKEKERWLIETSTDGEESSDYFTSGDEDRDHIRHDGGSSADEENRLKDFLRRNAREERQMRKQAEEEENQREKDLATIEKLRFERIPIPQVLRDKYGDELTEMNYNLPLAVDPNQVDAKRVTAPDGQSEQSKPELTKAQRIRASLLRQKRKADESKQQFIDKYIKDPDTTFQRKLLAFISLRKRCFNCQYFENKIDH